MERDFVGQSIWLLLPKSLDLAATPTLAASTIVLKTRAQDHAQYLPVMVAALANGPAERAERN